MWVNIPSRANIFESVSQHLHKSEGQINTEESVKLLLGKWAYVTMLYSYGAEELIFI